MILVFLEIISSLYLGHNMEDYLKFTNYEHTPPALFRPSDITGYELIPNSAPNINSLGMLDKEYAIKKPRDVYRILVLGDSITYPNLYPAILEDKLNNSGIKNLHFEVLNCGLPGIGIRQYADYLIHKGLIFEPDMVLVGFCISDFEPWSPIVYRDGRNLVEYSNPCPTISRKFINKTLFRYSNLYRTLLMRLEAKLYSKNKSNFSDYWKEEGMYYAQLIEKNTFRNDTALMCVIFPYLKPFEKYTDFEQADYRNMKEVLQSLDIDYLDLRQTFAKFDSMNLRMHEVDFVHPNLKGHEIAAEEVYNYLMETYFASFKEVASR